MTASVPPPHHDPRGQTRRHVDNADITVRHDTHQGNRARDAASYRETGSSHDRRDRFDLGRAIEFGHELLPSDHAPGALSGGLDPREDLRPASLGFALQQRTRNLLRALQRDMRLRAQGLGDQVLLQTANQRRQEHDHRDPHTHRSANQDGLGSPLPEELPRHE